MRDKGRTGGANVVGVGIDAVDVPRIERVLRRWGDRFAARVFTSGELDYSRERRFPPQHLSARFAGKEAVAKALGTGFRGGLAMRQIEIVSGEAGRPLVRLHGAARRAAARRGVETIFLSLSHTGSLAIAEAVAVGRADFKEDEDELPRK